MAFPVLVSCAVVNFLVAVASVAIQAIVILHHEDCAYSKMGIGVWNGVLLFATGCHILITVARKQFRNDKNVVAREFGMVVVSLTLMASLVQAGVASGVIYKLKNLQYTNNISQELQQALSSFTPAATSNGFDIARTFDAVQKGIVGWGKDQVNNVFKKTTQNLEDRMCFNLLSSGDIYGSTRIGLEYGLLAAGLIAVISQIISLIFLRPKLPVESSSIHYRKEVPIS